MKPIDRNNRNDLLKQIGRTEEKIAQINRGISKIDDEIESWDRRKKFLEAMKNMRKSKISKHQKYITQLENDIKNL